MQKRSDDFDYQALEALNQLFEKAPRPQFLGNRKERRKQAVLARRSARKQSR